MTVDIPSLKFWNFDEFKKDAEQNPFCNMGVQPMFEVQGIFNSTITFDYEHELINFTIRSDGTSYEGNIVLDDFEQPLSEEGYVKIQNYVKHKYLDCTSQLCRVR